MSIRVMIVDDHPVIREGVALLLDFEDGLEVVASLADGRGVCDVVDAQSVDVVLLDLDLPGANGVEVVETLRAHDPSLPILIFTAFDEAEQILKVMRAGVQGYLLKGSPRRQLCDAIRVVAQGGTWFAPTVTTAMLSVQQSESKPEYGLTARERDVLARLVEGLTNREVGQVLGVTERTIKFHVSAILRKLEVDNRTEAVALAIQEQLVKSSSG